jgi:hypothetical protein
MRKLAFKTYIGLFTLFATFITGCVVNSVYTFTAQLTPTMSVTSNALGSMDGSTQDSNSRLAVSGRYSGLSSAATVIEIISATRTCSLTNYPDADPKNGGFAGTCNGPATQADIDNLNNGQTRIVVKTVNNPAGEISGVIRRTN